MHSVPHSSPSSSHGLILQVLNQLLIPLLGLTGIPALLEFLEVKLTDHTQD